MDDPYTQTSKRNILAHVDERLLADTKLYGVSISEMSAAEVRGVLCFVLKNPDAIKALVPFERTTK